MERYVSESLQSVQSSSIPRSVVLSQTTHKIVNIVSSANHVFHQYLPQSDDTLVLNFGRKMSSNVSAPVQTYRPTAQNIVNMDRRMHHLSSESISTSFSLSPQDSQSNSIICSQTTSLKNVEPKPSPCPIKLVDMKKLLENPPVECNETILPDKITDSNLISCEQKIGGRKKTTPHKYVGNPNLSLHSAGKSNNKYIIKESIEVTVSQILDCLRVILPRTFDLSRLKTSDKVAGLVIKYLKLVGNKNVDNQVRMNLTVIIGAAKAKEQTYGDDITHPYHKIRYVALTAAIRRMFPAEFSVSELSNEKLKCLCVLLSQDVFIDGFSILRNKIHEFTREGRSCDVINTETNFNISTSDKYVAGVNTNNGKTLANSAKTKKSPNTIHRDNLSGVKNNEIGNTNKKQKSNEVTKLDNENTTNVTLNRGNVTISSKSQQPDEKKAKLATNMKLIINFLVLNKYSAGFALSKDKILFNLCKYIHIKCRKSNLEKLRKMLIFIDQNNLTKDNTEMIEDAINKTIQKNETNGNVAEQQRTDNVSQATCAPCLPPAQSRTVRQNYPPVKKRVENKLNLRPVVSLHNLIDYSSEQLLFMREERKYNISKYHDLRVPVSFTQNTSLQKYSSDQVRKLTNESYRDFRRIVMKRNGERVVFRLHYKRLSPGSSVFVKNVMCPLSGWLKGTVSKMSGPLRYIVQLDNGECWSCVPEQLRPFPENEPGALITYRSQRNIKPKQLFDL